ncbi:hypothetical protein PG996_000225 [Apiospora saccharicola]|uniref:NACHT domain-containing protein n=1 Tax=Apiospora saccharicola TaxID=335842 RepID=A0ABR1WD57_9PEZI
MVFDAIDESDDDNDRMVKLFKSLVQDERSRTKVIFLSRPRKEFYSRFWNYRRLDLQRENGGDVRKMVEYELDRLITIISGSEPEDQGSAVWSHASSGQARSSRHATNNASNGSRLRTRVKLHVLRMFIIERADGVILWVVLIFESLHEFARINIASLPENKLLSRLLKKVARFPLEFYKIYGDMVRQLTEELSQEQLIIAKRTLKWVSITNQHKQFTLGELRDALAIDYWSNNLHSSRTSHPIIDSRIHIESWSGFANIIRRHCGSFIEVLPPRERVMFTTLNYDSSEKNSNSQDDVRDDPPHLHRSHNPESIPNDISTSVDDDICGFSEDSAIQLMHQTVREFLTSSRAGKLCLNEEKALKNVIKASMKFVQLVIEVPLGSVSSTNPDAETAWTRFAAERVRYLDEFRLFPFCCELVSSDELFLSELKPLIDMIWTDILPIRVSIWADHNKNRHHIPHGWEPSMLEIMIYSATARGLKRGALNLLNATSLGSDPKSVDGFLDPIFFGIIRAARTIFCHEDTPPIEWQG